MREFRKFKCLNASKEDLCNIIPVVKSYLTDEDKIDFGELYGLPEIETSTTYAFKIYLGKEGKEFEIAFEDILYFYGFLFESDVHRYNEIPDRDFEVEYIRNDKEFDYSQYSRKGGISDLLTLAFIIGKIINYNLDDSDYLCKKELETSLYQQLGWTKVCSFKLKLKDESQPLIIRADKNKQKYIVLSDNVDFLNKDNQYDYLNVTPPTLTCGVTEEGVNMEEKENLEIKQFGYQKADELNVLLEGIKGIDEISYNEESKVLTVACNDERTYCFLSKALDKNLGEESLNFDVKIVYNHTINEEDIQNFFNGSKHFSRVYTDKSPNMPERTFIGFKKEVIQYSSDDFFKPSGISSVLAEDLARKYLRLNYPFFTEHKTR